MPDTQKQPETSLSQQALDDRAQRLMEDKDAESRTRVLTGMMDKVLTVVLLGWAVFQIDANMTGKLGAVRLRAAHVMFLLPL